MESSTKHGLADGLRHEIGTKYKSCWCHHCRTHDDHGWWRRHLHKFARRWDKKMIEESSDS